MFWTEQTVKALLHMPKPKHALPWGGGGGGARSTLGDQFKRTNNESLMCPKTFPQQLRFS